MLQYMARPAVQKDKPAAHCSKIVGMRRPWYGSRSSVWCNTVDTLKVPLPNTKRPICVAHVRLYVAAGHFVSFEKSCFVYWTENREF